MDLGIAAKRFLIVGGTSGMGLATARVLTSEGANVIITGRDEAKAQRAKESVAGGPGTVDFLNADITSTEQAL